MTLLISFLYLCLHIAVIVLIAYLIVWFLKWLNIAIDGNVYKAGQVVVALLILIAVVVWLSGAVVGVRW